jgi:hypothetical protein
MRRQDDTIALPRFSGWQRGERRRRYPLAQPLAGSHVCPLAQHRKFPLAKQHGPPPVQSENRSQTFGRQQL